MNHHSSSSPKDSPKSSSFDWDFPWHKPSSDKGGTPHWRRLHRSWRNISSQHPAWSGTPSGRRPAVVETRRLLAAKAGKKHDNPEMMVLYVFLQGKYVHNDLELTRYSTQVSSKLRVCCSFGHPLVYRLTGELSYGCIHSPYECFPTK